MKVSDVMTLGVISVGPDTPLRKAAVMMLQYELTGLRCSTAASSSGW